MAGSAAAVLLTDRLDAGFAALCASAALLALVAGAGACLLDDRRLSAATLAGACALAGLSLGATAAREAYEPPLLEWFRSRATSEAVVVEGLLREDASHGPGGVSLRLDVTSIDGYRFARGTGGGVRVSVGGRLHGEKLADWRAGRPMRFPTTLRLPSVYRNPGGRDERQALARRGIVLVGSVKSAALVEVVGRGAPLREGAAAVRAWTRRRVAAHLAARDTRSAGVTTAILIGDRSGLARDDERRLQEAGTYHVIAISGGNIAILAVLILIACRLVRLPARGAAIGTAAVLTFYGAVAAGAPSVSRAVTAAVLVLAARTLDHRGPSLNVLAVAALLAVAASPLVVLDAGFILSFGATLAIILGASLVVQSLGPPRPARAGLRHRLALPVVALFAATVCAELALVPVGASLFSRVPFAGLLLNFAAIPLMTLVQVGGLVVTFASGWWDGAARLGAAVAHFAAAGLLESARLVDAVPWLSATVRPPAWWVVVPYYLALLGLLHPELRRASAAALACTGTLMLAGPDATVRDAVPRPRMPLRIVVLDVGQGDATLVSVGGSRALLVDAGGLGLAPTPDEDAPAGFDIGGRVVAPALRALGVARLDAVVLTHGDPDHIQGVRGTLHSLAASSVWEGVAVPPHPGLRAIAALARARQMTWRTVQAGDVERFGEVEVRVLHPPIPAWERQRVRNDDSVVLEVRLGAVSIVLPGDIGEEAERAILPHLEPGRLVVLKAPHHGSATSSSRELLEALRPAVAIFSAGRNNWFGHPHARVVERYRAAGTVMFSTAEDGAVFVETDGKAVEVRGWSGRRLILTGREGL